MNKKLSILLFCGLIQSCATVDDYMLGKDNTLKPQNLEPLKSSTKVSKNWSIPAGSSHQATTYTKRKPVIDGKIAYIADKKGQVSAIHIADKNVVWSTALNHEIVSGPSIKNGMIAFALTESTLIVLNQQTGKKLWEAKVSGELFSNPVFAKDKIVIKTIDGNVYAFDQAKGEKQWTVNHGAPDLVLKASSAPVVMGDLILAGFSDGKLDAIDLKTGAVVWQRNLAYSSGATDVERLVDIDADPVIEGKIAYLASYQGYLGALSLDDGQFLWRKPASVYKNMSVGAGAIFLTDSQDVVWSISKNSGEVIWKQEALKARGLTEPVLMKDRLVVGDNTGLLHIISVKTGELIGRSQLSGAIDTAPVVKNGKLYVQTANGMLNQLSVG